MKQELDNESRQALMLYRMNRAYATLGEARLLADAQCFNAAVNRLYYACYYASVALLLANRISSQTHAGVKTMIGKHFVNTGAMPINIGKTLSLLFDKRQSGDYEDFVIKHTGTHSDLFG